jgi:hypothetical protein
VVGCGRAADMMPTSSIVFSGVFRDDSWDRRKAIRSFQATGGRGVRTVSSDRCTTGDCALWGLNRKRSPRLQIRCKKDAQGRGAGGASASPDRPLAGEMAPLEPRSLRLRGFPQVTLGTPCVGADRLQQPRSGRTRFKPFRHYFVRPPPIATRRISATTPLQCTAAISYRALDSAISPTAG